MPRKSQVVPSSGPLLGGSLVTNHSPDVAGLANYTVCRNWRRERSEMKLREGHDYYWPNTSGAFASDPGDQPFVNNATAVTPTQATFYQGIVTLQVPAGHGFVAGEQITVSGYNESAYNGTFTVSYVTNGTVNYAIGTEPDTPATGTGRLVSNEPINLTHQARRPNGKIAHIAGTRTRLFRFYSFEDSDYFEGTPGDPYFEDAGVTDDEYFNSNQGEWVQIASGFSVNGKRWQALSINGWSVFNNAVDLPVTYRVEETVAYPLYELREQGIAAVGCIEELNGILNCGSITEIQEDAFQEIMLPQLVQSSGGITANQSGTTVTATGSIFGSGHVGRFIIWDEGGEEAEIGTYTDVDEVEVVDSATVGYGTFRIRTKASQTGAAFSAPITASVSASSTTVTASASTFVPGDVGKTLRFVNGFESVIASRTSDTVVELADPAPIAAASLPYWLVDSSSDIVTAGSGIFSTDEIVGSELVWDSGESRTITERISSTQVRVNSDYAVPEGYISIENTAAYGAFTDYSKTNKIQYRHAWSDVNDPTRFAPTFTGDMVAGERRIVLGTSARSLELGHEITILGAGLLGGNLTATITSVIGGRVIMVDQPCETTVRNALIQRSDAAGSIIGQTDIQDDSSAIINMKRLRDRLVIYKDTAIVIAAYTGLVDAPWNYRLIRIPEGTGLFYRNSLIDIDADFHVYAGRNAFFTFDLSSQMPKVVRELEECSDLFFDEVGIEDDDEVFAVHCAPTNEIWISYPGSGADKVICWSYKHNTASTIPYRVLAAATMDRPEATILEGVSENWFVMALEGGTLCLFGRTDQPIGAWGGNEIYYTRSTNPYSATKGTYTATLTFGFGDFGIPYEEKLLLRVMPYFGIESSDTDVSFSIAGSRVPSQGATNLATFGITSPTEFSAIPMLFREHYYQDSYQVTVNQADVRFKGRQFEIRPTNSQSTARIQS